MVATVCCALRIDGVAVAGRRRRRWSLWEERSWPIAVRRNKARAQAPKEPEVRIRMMAGTQDPSDASAETKKLVASPQLCVAEARHKGGGRRVEVSLTLRGPPLDI